MSINTELDKIINEGKVNPNTAMVIFAIEIKSQGEKLDELKSAFSEDNERYYTAKDAEKVTRRVDRLENAILGLLGFVFMTVVGALITLIIRSS